MNCIEAQALVEDALDDSLSGGRKRALARHLSRCDACRAFFAAESAEHRRWFQALNAPSARHTLPDGFADGFVAEMARRHAMPQRRWAFVRQFRRIAAVLALLLGGAAMATWQVAEWTKGTAETEGTEEAAAPDPSEPLALVPLVPSISSVPSEPSFTSTTPQQGETETMTRKETAAVAIASAMAVMPAFAVRGDGYQFVTSGSLVASTTGCSSGSSSATSLTGGPLAGGHVYASSLEGRFRTLAESAAGRLRSDKRGITISFH